MVLFPFIKLVFSGSGREGVSSCIDALRHAYFWPFGGLPGQHPAIQVVLWCRFPPSAVFPLPVPAGRHNNDHSLLGCTVPCMHPGPTGDVLERLHPVINNMCQTSFTRERHLALFALRSNASGVPRGYVPQSNTGALSSQPAPYSAAKELGQAPVQPPNGPPYDTASLIFPPLTECDFSLMIRGVEGEEVFGRTVHSKLSSDRCLQVCAINLADWSGDVRDRVVRALSTIHRSFDNARVSGRSVFVRARALTPACQLCVRLCPPCCRSS